MTAEIEAGHAVAQTIRTNSLGWQVQQLEHRTWQWIEWQLSQTPDGLNPDFGAFAWPDWLANLITNLLSICAVVLLSWLIWRTVAHFFQNRQPREIPRSQVLRETPVVQHSANEWVQQAQQLAQAGQWQAACRAFYMAALQRLHDRQWITHQPSRTDQEYLHQLGIVTQPRPYQLLIRTHERSHFGDAQLSEENFQHCQQAYQELEKS